MNLNWKSIARDSVIVFLCTFVGGFIVGFVGAAFNVENYAPWLAVSNLVFGSAGFAYSSYQVTDSRQAHLLAVVIGVWLISVINPILGFSTVFEWIASVLFIAVFAAIGGVVGAVLRR